MPTNSRQKKSSPPKAKPTQTCDVLLVLLDRKSKFHWSLPLKPEKQLIGNGVKGSGKLEQPGVQPTHAKVWLERKTICFQPQGHPVWLNFVPINSEHCVNLLKGDLLHLGPPVLDTALLVSCTAELASAKRAAEQDGAAADLWDDDLGVGELTTAEQDVLVWLSRGETDVNAIAESLYRSVHTVNTQLKKVYSKLKARSKADLSAHLLRYRDAVERQKTALGRFAGTCDCRE
jgi:DNA-binding CsgD family transcriptional regulator